MFWMLLPELRVAAEHIHQKIARIKIALRQDVLLQHGQRQRDQMGQADVLPDHDPQVFGCEIAQRLLAQVAAGGDEVRLAGGNAPVVVFELLEGGGGILHHHRSAYYWTFFTQRHHGDRAKSFKVNSLCHLGVV